MKGFRFNSFEILVYILFGILVGVWLSDDPSAETKTENSPKPILKEPVQHRARVVVLNQNTQRVDDYRRVGHLHSSSRILPLYGRQTHRGSHLWQYYTMSDGNIPVRLSFAKDGRECDSEYGCKEIYDDETIMIEEYADTFRVNIDKPHMRYVPY